MRRNTGLTAIELVVVIAIIAILSGIAIPGFIRWRANAKLTGAATNLKADLEMAKLRAIRENDLVAVLFSGNGYTIFIDNGASPGNYIREADEQMLKNVQFIPGITSTNNFTSSRTRFDSRGLPANFGTVTITGQTGSRQIKVNRIGRIRIIW